MARSSVAVPLTSQPASASFGTSVAAQWADMPPPGVKVAPGGEPPVREIKPNELLTLGQKLTFLWNEYRSDRRIAELRWTRNQRQYLGIYDPEVEKELNVNRSKAYPRITRVKCISVLSRIMNLMFPGNERNWEIKASPSPDIKPGDVQKAIQEAQKRDQDAGIQSVVDMDYVMDAIKTLAEQRAERLATLIDDQLEELGGDQSIDYIHLCRKVLQSGIQYGCGLLKGPYVRSKKKTTWSVGPDGQVSQKTKQVYMPMFQFLPIWDFYPDMAARTFKEMDGYFERLVMSRVQLRKLADREDFFKDQITKYLATHAMGNYRPQEFEIELRAMGLRVNVNEMKTETSKFEVIVWHGVTSGEFLRLGGVNVPQDKIADQLEAEIWMIDGNVIKCELDPWAELDVDVKTLHAFLYDEDDTSPIGFGLPNAIRDSQMGISAATRMLMDNASVVCGPNLEINTDLLREDQDLSQTSAYKIWYREGSGPDAQFPAVRNVAIDAHLDDLTKIIELFMKFADTETFVGPATGGDMSQTPSEPMRTAAGASMLRGDAALPFKDIIRNFDTFTQSVILSILRFNEKFNPDPEMAGDYDVIARGATSLIAKEVRGMQVDQMAQSLTPEEAIHVNMRKLVEARFKVRDLGDLLVSEAEADRRQQAQDQQQSDQANQAKELAEANVRKLLSDGFKNITQGQKNSALADAASVKAALDLLEQGITNGANNAGSASASPPSPADGNDQTPSPDEGQPGNPNSSGGIGLPPLGSQGYAGGMPNGAGAGIPGGGQGLQ